LMINGEVVKFEIYSTGYIGLDVIENKMTSHSSINCFYLLHGRSYMSLS